MNDDPAPTPEHVNPSREARDIASAASASIEGMRRSLSGLERPKHLFPEGWVEDAGREMAKQQRESKERMDAQFEPIWQANREKLDREIKSVQLAGELVELQRALVDKQDEMLAMQRAQELEADQQRKREWVVIWLAAAALVATVIGVIATVAVAG